MVSHRHAGSNVSVRSERAVRGADVTELESVYKHNPLPSMPRFTTSGVQSKMAADSMLAYSERMRELNKARNEVVIYDESPHSVMEVRAQHIPKWRAPQKGVNPLVHASTGAVYSNAGSMHMGVKRSTGTSTRRTRPRSLDELIGRPDIPDPKDTSQSNRRFSVPAVVPSLAMTSVQDKNAEDKKVRISFVSAADLFDLVDFSLRSKQSRSESIKLAKAEDTLKLLTNASLIKTISPKTEEESAKVDPMNLLMVKGSASPREAGKSSNGEWAKRDLQPNNRFNPQSGVKQSSSDDEDILDLFREARALSQSSHKLKTRPKRAKRMKLYRSHLSAIPEDEHQNEQSAHAPELPALRLPVVPTSSSLAAIKGTRTKTPSSNSESMEETPRAMHTNSNKGVTCQQWNSHTKADDDGSSRRASPKDSEKHDSYSNFARTERTNDGDFTLSYSPRRHNTPRGENTAKKASENPQNVHSGGGRHPGSNVAVTGAKVKAQKKFRKLIFLRDYPDQSYTRYS